MNKQLNNMTFFEHVNELRYRILVSILFIFIFTILSYIYSSSIIDFLIQPVINNSINFQVLKITMNGNLVVWKKEEFLKNLKLMKTMEQIAGQP